MGSATAPAVMGGATLANIDYDVRDALGEIDRPSLVVRGVHDSLSTERSVAQLEAALADPEVVIFDGCGHLPMLEDRARFADVLAGFVDRVTTRR
jgi:proline iminopeptidase